MPDLTFKIIRNQTSSPPAHHVIPAPAPTGWSSYLPSLLGTSNAAKTRPPLPDHANPADDLHRAACAGFRNPWPSFHKPSVQEFLSALQWGPDTDTSLDFAASRVPCAASLTRTQQAGHLLRLETPDFDFDARSARAKATWLGHAGFLVQLAPLAGDDEPLRCLFDPMFSARIGGFKMVGPERAYPPPCRVEDLPPVDILMISHNHYDHLDQDTVLQVWTQNRARLHIVVPLGNKVWFVDCGIEAARVVELDWWESVSFSAPGDGGRQCAITCTPAQHISARGGLDADAALWASWYVEHALPDGDRVSVFFAGDTGYQFHGDPKWPPQPPPEAIPSRDPSSTSARPAPQPAAGRQQATPDQPATDPQEPYPSCPAFAEIASKLGPPDLLLLPVALGATWAYLRGWFSSYLPDAVDPFPRHSAGVTGAIHMPPWDAVRVLRAMTDGPTGTKSRGKKGKERRAPVAVAMHWGTFFTDPGEVLRTLGGLEWACGRHGVEFGRGQGEDGGDGDDSGGGEARFLALNHGQSVVV